MKNITFIKRILAVALCLVMVIGAVPITALADGQYTFPSLSQSGNNNSILRYYLTDENAGDIIITEQNGYVRLGIDLDDGWYFEKWETYFNGYEDVPILSDPEVRGDNPVMDGRYTFYNRSMTEPFVNQSGYNNTAFIYIVKGSNLYGDHKVTAVLKPIVTVNADDGVSYSVITNNPSYVNLANNQTAVKYLDDVTITYEIDEKYVLTSINASGTKDVSIDKANKVVKLNDTEKPTSVGINAKLKQQQVNFNSNDGTGTMETQVFEHSTAQALSTNEFTRDGYTFIGWNTKVDGSGISYGDGQSVTFAPANDGDSITLYAQWKPSDYIVSFDANGGSDIAPITVTTDVKYGRLPSSSVTGLSGGDSNWYLVDENGNVTDTKITKLSKVTETRDHTLFVKRKVLAPTISINLEVPGGISDGYQYYIPGNSQRVLTATVGNRNDEVLDYTYQWYKDGVLIEGADEKNLILPGNVADSGKYKVEVTATLKDGTGIVVTSNSAKAEKEQNVKILHAANTLYYDANGGENGPSSNYTGGTTITVADSQPTRENYIFCGWNTKVDGTGDEYVGGSTYTFAHDNGNGGCEETLYAQWKLVTHTVTYKIDGNVVAILEVEHGKDAIAPDIPAKEGYDKVAPSWDKDGKNITADTEINAVYTLNEYTIIFVDENGVYKEVTYKHGEEVEMPDVPTKNGYTVKWDTNVDKATGDLTIKAVYTKTVVNDDPENITNDNPNLPQTGDDSNLLSWLALLVVSGIGIFGIILNVRKNKSER